MTNLEKEFTSLVREYKSTIYSICMMFAKRPEETEDFVQEALINLWKGFESSQDICKTWVWRVTMNSCISIDRKRKRRTGECPLSADLENILNVSDSSERNSNVKMLYDHIHRLNIFDRAIIMLWLEGMAYDEIAEIMGISIKNVSVKLIRIKEQLKKMNNGE